MPVGLTRADRTLLTAGGVVFVLLVIAAGWLSATGDTESDQPTTFSSRSGGAKAAYLLLESTGYRVARWEQPPAELSDPAATTLVLAEPVETPTTVERTAIQQFIERGGHVIVTGLAGSLFLGRGALPNAASTGLWRNPSVLSPSPITRAAPSIALIPAAHWNPNVFAVPLYGDDVGPLVARVRLGGGDAIWWASDTPLTNAGLQEASNLDFFLACVGAPGDRRVLWDEYFHGYRRSLSASIWHSAAKWIALQFGVLAVALLATYSRRSGPIMPPAVPSRLSPLEFVHTIGALYRRAGAASAAVDIAYERFRYWCTRRFGTRPDASADVLAAAIATRPGVDATAVADAIRRCEAARQNVRLTHEGALDAIQRLSAQAHVLKLFSGISRESR